MAISDLLGAAFGAMDEDEGAPSGAPSAVPAPASDEPPPAPAMGPLLDETDPKKVFKAVHKIVTRQERLAKNRDAAGKHWSRVRRGVPFSRLSKSEDRAVWKADLPAGIEDAEQPIPNKADDLCNKITSQLMVDLPKPDPKPGSDSDKDRGAADLAKRFLLADGEESGTNDAELYRDALDTSLTRSSAFAWYWIDHSGGGWRPKQIMGHPQAADASAALMGPDGNPTTDPILRHVNDAGQFVASAAEAARQWLPKIRRRVLLPAHVRTVPEMAQVSEAEQVLVLAYDSLSEVKRRFPDVAAMSPEELKAIVTWKPPRAKDLLPPALRHRLKSQDEESEKQGDSAAPDDSALVFWYHLYIRPCPGYDAPDGEPTGYPDGAEIVVSGAQDGLVLDRQTLRVDVEPEGGDAAPDAPDAPSAGPKPVLLEIPVAQFRCLHDSEDRDPMGRPIIERFGGTNAAFAQIFGAVLEQLDVALHPNVYIPATSPVQSWQITERSGQPIAITAPEDKPIYEDAPQLPEYITTIIDQLEKGMSNAAGLNETAQGLDSAYAVSGKAKETSIAQSKVALEQVRQNFLAAVTRGWRIKLLLAQAYLTVPQQVELVGEDSAHKRRWWTGADLLGVADVSVQPGTGTLMAPAEKVQYAQGAQAASGGAAFDLDELRDLTRGSVAGDLGLSPNVHEQRVEREIAEWTKGPPQGWTPAMPAVDPATGQPAVDPATGQPAMQPASYTPFQPRPHDEEPPIAMVRHRRMTRFMATGDYLKQPPEWRAVFDEAHGLMAYAAGVQTVRQQAEAAAAQAAAQQQAQVDGATADAEGKAADHERAQESAEADHGRAMEREQMKANQQGGMT